MSNRDRSTRPYRELRDNWPRIRRAKQAIRIAFAIIRMGRDDLKRRVRRRLRF